MTWLLLAIFGWTCAAIGFLIAAMCCISGRHRTPEDDDEQAAYLAAQMHGDGSL